MRRGASARRLQVLQFSLAVPVAAVALGALLLGPTRLALGGRAPHTFTAAGVQLSYPAANAAAAVLLAIATLGAVVLVRAARFGIGATRAYRRQVAALPIVGRLAGHPDVLLFAEQRPQAFCAGLLRPRTYVSTGAVRALARDELDAVVAHEAAHRRARDPLRLFVARVVAQAVFPLPVCGLICDRMALATELDADQAALRTSAGDRRPLAGALLQMAHGVDPARVDVLDGARPDLRLPGRLVAASLASVAALSYGLWTSLRAAEFRASLALPGLSAKPCVLVLALVPSAAVLLARVAVRGRRAAGAGRRARRRSWHRTGQVHDDTATVRAVVTPAG
jgi:hypothetical protein